MSALRALPLWGKDTSAQRLNVSAKNHSSTSCDEKAGLVGGLGLFYFEIG